MPNIVSQTLVKTVGQFGGSDSQTSGTFKLFGIDTGLADLVGGAAALEALVKPIPWMFYEKEYNQKYGFSENYVHFDSPNLAVPGYGTYDFQGFAGFDLDIGIYADYSYDFGNLQATVSVSAPHESDETVINGAYALTTAATTINVSLNSLAPTQPFSFDLLLGGSNGLTGSLGAGIRQLGVYKGDSPTSWTTNKLFLEQSWDSVSLLGNPSISPGDAPIFFGNDKVFGTLSAPTLPQIGINLSATGAQAIGTEASDGGTGPAFASLAVDPIAFVPVVGDLNKGSLTVVDNWLIAAGLDYRILGVDVGLSAALEQHLTVSIDSVAVTARALEDLSEDSDFDDYKPGNGGDSRALLPSYSGGYVTVAEVSGKLGDTLYLGNLTPGANAGERNNTRVIEEYDVTLRVDTSIGIVLTGGVKLSFLEFSAFINPIVLDELRKDIGPIFSTNLSLDLASVEVFNDHFLITFDNAAVIEHTITSIIKQAGTPGNDKIKMGQADVNVDAGGGNDTVLGNNADNAIEGGTGNDILLAGNAGDDSISGGSGWDVLSGGVGDDRLDTGSRGSGSGTDSALGLDGNDSIYNYGQKASLDGGTGDDLISTEIKYTVTTSSGPFGPITTYSLPQQTIKGGDGIDLLRVDASVFSRAFNLDFAALGSSAQIKTDDSVNPVALTYENIEQFDFRGGTADDTISGNALDDVLNGGDGRDTLAGRDGRDQMDGGNGDDQIYGDDGDDSIFGGTGGDLLVGGLGSDALFGNAEDDWIYGQFGADILNGGDGNDTIDGGNGEDRDYLYGLAGDDHLIAGGGADELGGWTGNDVLAGGSGAAQRLMGEDGDDAITLGTGAGTTADGGEGNDRITVTTSSGAASLNGGAGSDTLVVQRVVALTEVAGSGGYASPIGTAGVLTLKSAGTIGGNTSYTGFEAFDLLFGSASDKVSGGGGNDRLRGGGGADYLDGNNGTDELIGGSGNDTLVGTVADSFDGGAGDDLLVFMGAAETAGYTLSIGTVLPGRPGPGPVALPQPVGNSSGGYVLGIERLLMVFGGAGDDHVAGGLLADTLQGGVGNDDLSGEAGDDMIDAGIGSDTVHGGDGNDKIDGREFGTYDPSRIDPRPGEMLYGDAGNDTIQASNTARMIDGGGGNDVITVTNGGKINEVGFRPDLNGGAGSDTITGSALAEHVIGGLDPVDDPSGLSDPNDPTAPPAAFDRKDVDLADTIHGGGGNDLIEGGAGGDQLWGDLGDDRIFGGSGHDMIAGGDGADVLYGGSGDDQLSTGNGVGGRSPPLELLVGGVGNDTLTGTSAASLEGGKGDDRYDLGVGGQTVVERLPDGAGANRVYGFDTSIDVIRLEGNAISQRNLSILDSAQGAVISLNGVTNSPFILLSGVSSAEIRAGNIVVVDTGVSGVTVRDETIALASALADRETSVFEVADSHVPRWDTQLSFRPAYPNDPLHHLMNLV